MMVVRFCISYRRAINTRSVYEAGMLSKCLDTHFQFTDNPSKENIPIESVHVTIGWVEGTYVGMTLALALDWAV